MEAAAAGLQAASKYTKRIQLPRFKAIGRRFYIVMPFPERAQVIA
jgi:hypothetical protein